MPTAPIKKQRNYFICTSGRVFKVVNGKEEPVPIMQQKISKKVFVQIDKSWKELLYLMMEYFDVKYTPRDRIKYTINEKLEIPLTSIIVKPVLTSYGLAPEDEIKLIEYKCDQRANSANRRHPQKISATQVYLSLKIHSFTCVYCAAGLNSWNWHLDHFDALAKGGKNVFENLVPSCPRCNIMKGAMDGNQFVAMCKRISKNHFFQLPETGANPPPETNTTHLL